MAKAVCDDVETLQIPFDCQVARLSAHLLRSPLATRRDGSILQYYVKPYSLRVLQKTSTHVEQYSLSAIWLTPLVT